MVSVFSFYRGGWETTKSGKRPFANLGLQKKLGFIDNHLGTSEKVRSYKQLLRSPRKKRGFMNDQKLGLITSLPCILNLKFNISKENYYSEFEAILNAVKS